MRFIIFLTAAFLLSGRGAYAAEAEQRLTLEQAIKQALQTSPRLKAAEASVRASIGGERQAALRSNPEFSVEVENFGGSGAYRRFDAAEATYRLSQTIELGGKRGVRRAVAAGDRQIAEIEVERQKLDLIQDVTVAYGEALAASERVTLARNQKQLADDVAETVKRFVQSAREPLVQSAKANLARTTAGIALAQAERDLVVARRTLVLLVGLDGENITLDPATLSWRMPLPALGDLRALLAETPDLAFYGAVAAKGRATMAGEKAQAIPDPRVSLGVRDFEDTGNTAFLLAVAIPIPVANRNQGNIEKARQQIVRAESERQQAILTIERVAQAAHESARTADLEAKELEETALPQASEALTLAREGYALGRFDYLEVLDAQRTLYDVRVQIIDSIKRSFIARAELDRLTARYMTSVTGEEVSQ